MGLSENFKKTNVFTACSLRCLFYSSIQKKKKVVQLLFRDYKRLQGQNLFSVHLF